jgi:hypothetical protein
MAERTDQQPDPSEELPVIQPPTVDPDWRKKIEAARQARQLGKKLRKDKPSSFRRAVGRAA